MGSTASGASLASYGGELSGWLTPPAGGVVATPPTPAGGYLGTPAATAPAAPTIGTASAGNISATVTWTAPANTGGSGPGPGFAIVGGPHPGHIRSSASRSDHTGAWSPSWAAPTPRRPARPRRTPRPPRRPSPTRAAQPIALQNARRFPHPRFQLSDSRNRRRRTACGASGPLRRPRKGHKSRK
jgi:hypothetical protein